MFKMPLFAPTIGFAILVLFLMSPPARAEMLVQIVIDHSGVLHDEQDPQGKTTFNSFLAEFLQDLARTHRRDREDTRVVLISAVAPPRIIWSGDAASFYRRGVRSPAVNAIIAGQPNGCNDLPEALEEVEANARLQPAQELALHIITSGVHSGRDCANLTQEEYVSLVETTDPNVAAAIRHAAEEIGDVTIHFLTAAQRRGLLEQLGTAVVLRAQGQTTGF